MSTRQAGASGNRGRTGAADAHVDIAKIAAKGIEFGLLDEAAPAIIRSRHMAATGLPGHVDGAIGAINCDRRFGGVGLSGRRNLRSEASSGYGGLGPGGVRGERASGDNKV